MQEYIHCDPFTENWVRLVKMWFNQDMGNLCNTYDEITQANRLSKGMISTSYNNLVVRYKFTKFNVVKIATPISNWEKISLRVSYV